MCGTFLPRDYGRKLQKECDHIVFGVTCLQFQSGRNTSATLKLLLIHCLDRADWVPTFPQQSTNFSFPTSALEMPDASQC